MVRLLIADHQMIKAKAATGVEDAEKREFEIEGEIDIYIYDQDGLLEFKRKFSLDDESKTEIFYLSSGEKKIYAFANRPAGSYSDPKLGTTVSALQGDMIRNITFGMPVNRPAEIATYGQFALGTLWEGDPAVITGEGTVSSPQRLKINIGRTAAKIRLEHVSTRNKLLKGTFGNHFVYTLRSVPTRTYGLGKYDNSTANTPGAVPPARGIRFISAVHEELPLVEELPNPVFVDYDWPDAEVTDNIGEAYYAVENITKPMVLTTDGEAHLYYGNTTYISLRTHYTPGAEDKFLDGADPTREASCTGGVSG